jgi:aspartyl-tRNA(Asn)/glutamyl-tRNA(Gln) amidotransferase subunit A
VGFKQSAGVVPHDSAPDAFANISSINPMARSVMDTALMLEAMAGQHPCDPYSYGAPSSGFVAAARAEGSLAGTRIAWRPLLANTVIDSEVLEACEMAAMALGQLGASVEPMDDDIEPVEPIWFAYSSALWNARFRDLLPQWGNKLSPTLLRQMELGKDLTAEAVGRALLARTQLYRKVQGWFESFDLMAMPTLTRTAIPIGERLFEPIEIEGQKVDTVRKAWYPYTHPFNLTGHPAITLPCGLHSDGLPMAIQLVGRRCEDARLLRIAALFEEARPWAARRPRIEGLA